MSKELYPKLLSEIYFIANNNDDEKIEVVRKSIFSIYNDLIDCIKCSQCDCDFASHNELGSYIVIGMYNGGIITRTLRDTLALDPDKEDDDHYLFRSYGQLTIDCSPNHYRDAGYKGFEITSDDRSKMVSHLRSNRDEFLSEIFINFLEHLSHNGYLGKAAFDAEVYPQSSDFDKDVPF